MNDERSPQQDVQLDEREHINREKGRDGIETPRTVDEQVEQLDPGTDEHRRRDPLAGAKAQRSD